MPISETHAVTLKPIVCDLMNPVISDDAEWRLDIN